MLTNKSLYTQVIEEISKRTSFNTVSQFGNQSSHTSIQPLALSTTGDTSAQEILRAVYEILEEALPARIISGLMVQATDPISANVVVTAGKGTIGGKIFTLTEDTTVPTTFTGDPEVWFLSIKDDGIKLDTSELDDRLVLAKIVVPYFNTEFVQDTRDNGPNAYIVQFHDFKLYGNPDGFLEEDSMEKLRQNLDVILADNIFGELVISENLTITNTAGSVRLDSSSVNIYDTDSHLLSKFNDRGIFFYNTTGIEIAKFGVDGAHVGNLEIKTNAIQSKNFITGYQGFQIKDDGNVEFNNLTVRGTIYATGGTIGGFTITPTKLYGGTIQTALDVASGSTGVVMDSAGLRGYDSVLGNTFNLPTDGSAPTFSSGIIRSVIFEINTNSVLRTSETVGDGTSNSAGVLINNTGIYGVAANQTLSGANLRALIDGTIRLQGTVYATSGQIGGVTITSDRLSGGLIEGATIRAGSFETSSTVPKVRIDSTGIYYQVTTSVGTYGASGSGHTGFKYGSGTKYGAGVTAYLFKSGLPIFSVEAAVTNIADIHLFSRSADPTGGTQRVGDLIVVNGKLKICTVAGSPGTFVVCGTQS